MINNSSDKINLLELLDRNYIHEHLKRLGEGWNVNENGHLYKEYQFNNFSDGMVFANQIANIADDQAHHPLLSITWGLCAVEIWTHEVGGITEKDLILAEKISILK